MHASKEKHMCQYDHVCNFITLLNVLWQKTEEHFGFLVTFGDKVYVTSCYKMRCDQTW